MSAVRYTGAQCRSDLNITRSTRLLVAEFHVCTPNFATVPADGVELYQTPQMVASRSPFLFTCVCAVASKFYRQRPELYSKIMTSAKELAINAVAQSFKCALPSQLVSHLIRYYDLDPLKYARSVAMRCRKATLTCCRAIFCWHYGVSLLSASKRIEHGLG